VTIDIYDLKEGNDKYAFMERMVTDSKISHVLIVSDSEYTKRADERKKGVGVESQIISEEVYRKVDQSKFIPIVTEFVNPETPCLPVFLKSKIWIDFSSPEAVNKNWERLVRLLFGKPLHEKPELGKTPAYITDPVHAPATPARAKWFSLKDALESGKRGIKLFRSDFLDACFEFADRMRVRDDPTSANLAERILQDCGNLVPVRNLIVDWILLESQIELSVEFQESVISFLERLLELRSRPASVTTWNEEWFAAHKIFAYECFLYIVAALVKVQGFELLRTIYTASYMQPETEARSPDDQFEKFDSFYASSQIIGTIIKQGDRPFLSPTAELIKRQSDRPDLPFELIMQAELLTFLMALLTPNARWYPQTLLYARYTKDFPLFVRAAQHKTFAKLSVVTGIPDVKRLKEEIAAGAQRMGMERWNNFYFHLDLWSGMNLNRLDSVP
jgi:hypothetical protein